MNISISEVQINLIKPYDGLIGFASLVINGQLFIGSIGIHKKLSSDGYRLTYPNKKIGSAFQDIFHPINRETGLAIETAVLGKLKDVMKNNDRHDCINV